jgi:hypothetical protein
MVSSNKDLTHYTVGAGGREVLTKEAIMSPHQERVLVGTLRARIAELEGRLAVS